MSNYKVFLISDNGDGIPESLEDWDGESERTFHLAAYANNAVIVIEPDTKQEADNE